MCTAFDFKTETVWNKNGNSQRSFILLGWKNLQSCWYADSWLLGTWFSCSVTPLFRIHFGAMRGMSLILVPCIGLSVKKNNVFLVSENYTLQLPFPILYAEGKWHVCKFGKFVFKFISMCVCVCVQKWNKRQENSMLLRRVRHKVHSPIRGCQCFVVWKTQKT